MEVMEPGPMKPIVVQVNTNILIDGLHRLEAAKRLGLKSINVIFEDISDFDLRIRSYQLNSRHGVHLTLEERNRGILKLCFEEGRTKEEIASVFGLDPSTVRKIISNRHRVNGDNTPKDLRRKLDDADKLPILRKWSSGEVQKQIAKDYGVAQSTIFAILSELKSEIRERYTSGGSKSSLVQHYGLDSSSIDEILPSVDNPDPLNFTPQTTTWWPAFKLDSAQDKTATPLPVLLIKNILTLFTNPGQHIVDLFAGGGSTSIACSDMVNRTCELFDLKPRNNDIKEHILGKNMAIPTSARKPDMVILDPPYGDIKAGYYSDHPDDLSNIPIDAFLERMEILLANIHEAWHPRVCIVMTSKKKNGFIDLPLEVGAILKKKYTSLEHIVSEVGELESLHGGRWNAKANEERFLLRKHIHVMVAEA